MVESNYQSLKPWRADVKEAARRAREGKEALEGPVEVSLMFRLPRPKSHYGTGRNAGLLKDSAPLHVAIRPDIDKLTRAVLDSLTEADWWEDDGQVARLRVEKLYADRQERGVEVIAWAL